MVNCWILAPSLVQDRACLRVSVVVPTPVASTRQIEVPPAPGRCDVDAMKVQPRTCATPGRLKPLSDQLKPVLGFAARTMRNVEPFATAIVLDSGVRSGRSCARAKPGASVPAAIAPARTRRDTCLFMRGVPQSSFGGEAKRRRASSEGTK